MLRNRPTLSIGMEKACLSKQPPWRAAGDPRLAHGRSRVWAPGPAGGLAACIFFSTFPSFLLRESFFRTFPTKPAKVLGINNMQTVIMNIMYQLHFYCIQFSQLSPNYSKYAANQDVKEQWQMTFFSVTWTKTAPKPCKIHYKQFYTAHMQIKSVNSTDCIA